MGAMCSSTNHHQYNHVEGNNENHIFPNRNTNHDNPQLNAIHQKLQFIKKEKSTKTSLSNEEFLSIQTRASSEMRKASSYRIPNTRVTFIGLSSFTPTSSQLKTKTQEELNLELSSSFLPQHLLYCLRYIYYGGESKQIRAKLGSNIQKVQSQEELDTESNSSAGSHSKLAGLEVTAASSTTSIINNQNGGSPRNNVSTSMITKKKSFSPGMKMWKKSKPTSSSKPVEESRMKHLTPMSEFLNETCILLIEMKGFSKIVDSFYEFKKNYDVVDITRYIYYIYTSLIAVIYEMGGDIENFQGDLIICQFFSPRMDRTFTDSILAAIKCGLRIQSMTNLKNHKSNDSPLEVKCLVSVGECKSYHLGGFGSQWIRIVGGDVIIRSREILQECKHGNVYTTSEAVDKCKQFARVIEESPGLYQVSSISREIASNPLPCVSFHYTFAETLFLFMNRNVMSGIERRKLDTFNSVIELVLCTVALTSSSFGSNLCENDLQIKNDIICFLQMISEKYNCCLLDIFFDRDSVKFILSFERIVVQSNPSVIVECIKDVIKKEILQVSGVGIATGYGYRASVGSDFRRHFGLYGELVTLSISYCNYAIEEMKSGIVCDRTTTSILNGVCKTKFIGICEIAGKAKKLHSISLGEPSIVIAETDNETCQTTGPSEGNIYLSIDSSTLK